MTPRKDRLPLALLQAEAYPHPVTDLRLIETHMSWVFLTGRWAYKVKKPVHFEFADFSKLGQREHFCREELRCNRRFASLLYEAVVPVVSSAAGGLRIGDPEEAGAAVEWAVQMTQFDPALQADRLLDAKRLDLCELQEFGQTLAAQHHQIPSDEGPYDPVAPVTANFLSLLESLRDSALRHRLKILEEATRAESEKLLSELLGRQAQGRIREAHGDLHLSNMVRLDRKLHAFDCLEFDRSLRCIDGYCDAAFLQMDLLVRGRPDLAYGFIDGYADSSGDYGGLPLLPYFARYRSMVRAKVAALRLTQAPTDPQAVEKLERHLQWAEFNGNRPAGRLFVMSGVSGTGKSYWARQLVAALGALRLRSDVLRKAEFNGDGPAEQGIAQGLYGTSTTDQLYTRLAALSARLVSLGETVIVDATCLQRAQRDRLIDAVRHCGGSAQIIRLTAPRAVLEARIRQRSDAGRDVSDADVAVLHWQQSQEEVPVLASEPVQTFDTTRLTLEQLLRGLY